MFCVLYAYGIRPDTGQVGLWRGCVMSRTILVGVLGVESGARRPRPSLPRSQQARRRAARSRGEGGRGTAALRALIPCQERHR